MLIKFPIHYTEHYEASKSSRKLFLNATLLTHFTFKPNFRRPSCTTKCIGKFIQFP